MEILKNLKNYHFGMGIIVMVLQTIFQLSNMAYFMGIFLVLFAIYENSVITKLVAGKDNKEIMRSLIAQYKWVNLFLIFPILFLSYKCATDMTSKKGIIEEISEDPIGYLNIIGITFIILHFSTIMNIKRIERTLIND